jgi:hypothetical protein
MTTERNPLDFLYEDLLGDVPELTYYSFQDQFGKGGNQKRHFQGQFQNILDQFQGTLGSQLQQGITPTGTFNDFLENYNFDETFGSIAPSSRGANTARFSPQARLINF